MDKVSGDITGEMFGQLSKNFAAEQAELRTVPEDNKAALDELNRVENDMSRFIKSVKKYTEINALAPEILAEFIDKVVVYHPDKSTGKRTQRIDIFFRGVGGINFC